MRRLTIFLAFIFAFALVATNTLAQESTFTSKSVDYEFEIPSPTWRVVTQPDGINQHAEFIYGDRNDGYLQIRKEVVDAGMTASDVSRSDQDQKLHFLPGYVSGKEERFSGRLNGVVYSYEFTRAGKPMTGRIYYLQADNRTVYMLRFTGERDKLARIRNQTDNIARSFHLK